MTTQSPAQAAGMVIGTECRVVTRVFHSEPGFAFGDIVVLHYDDKTDCPLFKSPIGGANYLTIGDSVILASDPAPDAPTTPAVKAGLVVGGKVRVLRQHGQFSRNQIVTLTEDDGTHSPRFTSENGNQHYMNLSQASIDLEIPESPNLKEVAVATFRTLLERADVYRSTGVAPEGFDCRYGICDNVPHAKPEGACSTEMGNVKDNVIRLLPSYSGSYHYPVKAATGDAHDDAFNRNRDKWTGAYGDNRFNQLRELLEWVSSDKWHDGLVNLMTPCQRVGYKEGDLFIIQGTSGVWRLERDDASAAPYFRAEGTGNTEYYELKHVSRIQLEAFEPNQSVAEYLEAIEAQNAKLAEAQKALEAMQTEVARCVAMVAMLDGQLAQVHKVKRL